MCAVEHLTTRPHWKCQSEQNYEIHPHAECTKLNIVPHAVAPETTQKHMDTGLSTWPQTGVAQAPLTSVLFNSNPLPYNSITVKFTLFRWYSSKSVDKHIQQFPLICGDTFQGNLSPGGCLRPRIVPNPTYTMCFLLPTYL